MPLASPWEEIGPSVRKAFERELASELGEAHELFGLAALAVARRRDRDDVAFALSDGRVMVVHLTWSSRRELPGWPSHVFHPNMDAFIAATALSGDET